MRTIKVSVTPKFGKAKDFDYDEPENWAEAVEYSKKGETFEFKQYLTKRKSNFQDKQRKALDEKALQVIKKLTADQMAELAEKMGISLDD